MPNNQESRHHPDPTYNWGKFNHRTPDLDILSMSKNGKCRFGMQKMKYNENIQTLKTEINYNFVIQLSICSVITTSISFIQFVALFQC